VDLTCAEAALLLAPLVAAEQTVLFELAQALTRRLAGENPPPAFPPAPR
jgi:hypothetical protein